MSKFPLINGLYEYEQIVEFSFNEKESNFVIRFLDGRNYVLSVSDLPQELKSPKVEWSKSFLSKKKDEIQTRLGRKIKRIPYHMIHSKGIEL